MIKRKYDRKIADTEHTIIEAKRRLSNSIVALKA